MEKIELTEMEQHWLAVLYDKDLKYLARDRNNLIYAYSKIPIKEYSGWTSGYYFEVVPEIYFKFIEPMTKAYKILLTDSGTYEVAPC